MRKTLVVGIIILLVGLFYLAAPHSLHISSGLGFNLEHNVHQVLGLILIIIGAVIIWKKK